MERVLVRQATSDDFNGVVRISKGINDGYDPLPDTYFTCLENPNRCVQVAEWNGQIVAFSAVLVVDAGRTAILQYSRTDEGVRGKGIFRQLKLRQFVEFVYPKFPRIVRLRSSSRHTDFWDAKTDGTTIDMKRTMVYFSKDPVPYDEFLRLLPQRMASLRQQLPIDSLSHADGNTLNKIMAEPVSKKHLFPEGIIVSKRGAIYDAHKTNTSVMMQSCAACFVGGSASSIYTSFSFGNVFTCPIGRVYHIDYYGPKDDSMILAHVARHLPFAPEISRKEPVTFKLLVKETCMGQETKRRFEEFAAANITPNGPPPRYLRMYSMTHPLPVPSSQ